MNLRAQTRLVRFVVGLFEPNQSGANALPGRGGRASSCVYNRTMVAALRAHLPDLLIITVRPSVRLFHGLPHARIQESIVRPSGVRRQYCRRGTRKHLNRVPRNGISPAFISAVGILAGLETLLYHSLPPSRTRSQCHGRPCFAHVRNHRFAACTPDNFS